MNDISKILFLNDRLKISITGTSPVVNFEINRISNDRIDFVETCVACLKVVKGLRPLYRSFYALVNLENCQVESTENLEFFLNETLVEFSKSVNLLALVITPHPSDASNQKLLATNNVEFFDSLFEASKAVSNVESEVSSENSDENLSHAPTIK